MYESAYPDGTVLASRLAMIDLNFVGMKMLCGLS